MTECPYCGTRLRKRAPDLKKQKKADEKIERRNEKRRERLKAQYEGGEQLQSTALARIGPVGRSPRDRPGHDFNRRLGARRPATFRHVSDWMLGQPCVHRATSRARRPCCSPRRSFILSAGYAFVCLFDFAVFRRRALSVGFGRCGVVALSGSSAARAGIGMKALARDPSATLLWARWAASPARCSPGRSMWSSTVRTCAITTRSGWRRWRWSCARLPIATDSASVWMLLGGALVGGDQRLCADAGHSARRLAGR